MARELPAARRDFARCRVLMHAWQVIGEHEVVDSRLIVLRCESCGTVRYDRWNPRTGARWGKGSYQYPDGYKDTEPGHDREWWRKTYAEFLYADGLLDSPPSADTRKRGRKGA